MRAKTAWRVALGVGALSALCCAALLYPEARLIDEPTTLRHYAVRWSLAACLINSAVLALLTIVCPWWAEKKIKLVGSSATPEQRSRWFWIAVAAAAIALAFMTIPRLGHSLWDDEETSLRFSILGRYLRAAHDGRLQFHEASWLETLFYYKQPNNHVLHNVLARVSNSVWRSLSHPDGLQFREEAVRLPAFFAGIAGVFSLALLLKAMGYPNAGILAAWLLAFHPWYQRYVCEARGYSLVLALLPIAALVWRRALSTGRWRSWSAFALLQLSLIWTYPAVLFVLVPLNLATPWLALKGRDMASPPLVSLARWFCCQSLAAVAALQLLAPLVPQAREYFRPLEFSTIDPLWVANCLAYIGAGLPWGPDEPGQPLAHPDLGQMMAHSPAFWAAAYAVALAAAAWGIITVLKRRDAAWSVVFFCGLLGPLFQMAYAAWYRLTFWEWYLLHVLPWAVALVSVGLERFSALVRYRFPSVRAASAAIPILALAFYALLTEPVRRWQWARPVTPTRDAVLSTRLNLDPDDPENLRIMTAGLTNPPACYDANVFFLKDPGELVMLCRMADLSGRPLWLNIGHLWALRAEHPDAYRMVLDQRLFAGQKVLRGHNAMGDRMVCRYIPGSMDRRKAAEYITPEDELFIERSLKKTPEEYFSSNF